MMEFGNLKLTGFLHGSLKRKIAILKKENGLFDLRDNTTMNTCDVKIEFHRPEIISPVENNIINHLKSKYEKVK